MTVSNFKLLYAVLAVALVTWAGSHRGNRWWLWAGAVPEYAHYFTALYYLQGFTLSIHNQEWTFLALGHIGGGGRGGESRMLNCRLGPALSELDVYEHFTVSISEESLDSESLYSPFVYEKNGV